MSNNKNETGQGSTSSGQGALGMGGSPSDNPRDEKRGGAGRTEDDRGGGTGPVDGAFGNAQGDRAGGGTPNETTGVGGDEGAVDIQLRKSGSAQGGNTGSEK